MADIKLGKIKKMNAEDREQLTIKYELVNYRVGITSAIKRFREVIFSDGTNGLLVSSKLRGH